MAEAVQRLDSARLSGTRRYAGNGVHRPGLDLEAAPGIGHDRVFRRALRDEDGFPNLREEVHDRRAGEPKTVCRHVRLEDRCLAVKIEINVESIFRVGQSAGRRTEIHKQELLGEGKELRKQTVAQERPRRIGEQPFVAVEADRPVNVTA